MRKQLLFLLLICLGLCGFSQKKTIIKNALGVSTPLIWNYSNGIYYSLGNRQKPSGKDFSYGININYTRTIYKNWFATAGIGYFNQSFNISRPFNFDGDTITNLLYSTKNYNYDCITLHAGLGYGYSINDKFIINGIASFNSLKSFKQKYSPTGLSGYQHKTTQTNKKNMQIGNMVNLSAGTEYILTKKISIGADIVFPIITKWKDDEIFIKYYYNNDSRQIAENKFTIGTAISFKYHF